MDNILKGKKILFIAANFFSYEKKIYMKLTEMGAQVDYFDERPGNDFITKSLIRVNKNILAKKNSAYYEEIINSTENQNYDYILIIKGEVITEEWLKNIKQLHKNAKLILYLWDSISYNPNAKKVKNLFDKVYTFDPDDVKIYPNMIFRPLFFLDSYKNIKKVDEDLDLVFIGTVHTDRYNVIKSVQKQLKDMNLNGYFYMYYPNRILFWLKKIFDPKFKTAKYSEFKFKGISSEEIINIYARSKAILDIERPKQKGLTIRTLEVLGAHKKIVTTNDLIVDYDFYNKNNVHVINRKDVLLDSDFFDTKYRNIDESIYNRYSITTWINDIFRD
ncbi:lipopolysaccharide biosynthesis protein [Metabacillus bambusae]|uniref:Lipopolysaccharide biosynthesis protein n=1 Tax=Metabacillus bambusae TaxID=2795218 RepID=A0ABS3N0U6_9BACI|nr:lipopolysaccharide biosynthesis protein [Metabacillus bambusae]MBO1511896.1 lipopolysaccharide biosynthesis protein [Metabacillus bambusae]